MKALIYKELRLALHPTAVIFLGLGAMLLIPDYPYTISFIYTCLAVFFLFLSGRENRDLFFTACLPVTRGQMVKARCITVGLMEIAQIAVAGLFALLRLAVYPEGRENLAGMEPNMALFGFAFGLYAVFNTVYLPLVYGSNYKCGIPLALAGVAVAGYITLVEGGIQAVPALRQSLDTMDAAYAGIQGAVLAGGALLFALSWLWVSRLSQGRFERVDL